MAAYTSEFSEMAANRLSVLFKSCWMQSDITLKRSPSCLLWCWFSLRVFVSCFRSVSKWPHFSFLSEQVFPLCFPFFFFFSFIFFFLLKWRTEMAKSLFSLRVVLQTCRWKYCPVGTEEISPSFLVEISSQNSGTYKLFCSWTAIFWT